MSFVRYVKTIAVTDRDGDMLEVTRSMVDTDTFVFQNTTKDLGTTVTILVHKDDLVAMLQWIRDTMVS